MTTREVPAPDPLDGVPASALALVTPAVSGFAGDLAELVAEATDALADPEAVGDALDYAAKHGGAEGYARLLHSLARLTAAARIAQQAVELALLDVLPSGGLTLPGIGTLEPKGGTKRTSWDTPLLLDKLHAIAIDPARRVLDTGELVPEGEAVRDTIALAARLEWRSTALRKLGIDPDSYAQTERGTRRIKATWAKADDASNRMETT